MISFIKTAKALTVVINGKPFNVSQDHPSFEEICEELKKGSSASSALLLELIDVTAVLNGKTFGKVTVSEDKVFYAGRPVGSALTERIVTMLREGYDIEPWALFMDNVYKNPAEYAREELFLFLESGNLPITPDGHFLAFKNVRSDMRSHYDGKTLHTIGKALEMPREAVDPVRDRTCSSGLHFCSQSYLGQYHSNGGLTLIVKINPADVVSIPSDYNNTKGRAWRYVPYAVIEEGSVKDAVYNKPVLGELPNGEATFEDKKLKKAAKKPGNSSTKIHNKTPAAFLKAIKAAGGARPYAKDHGLAKSTVQDWVKKAKDVLGI